MLVLEKLVELLALVLLGSEAIGFERASRWEVRLRDRLWLAADQPAEAVPSAFHALDHWLAGAVARFNRWKVRRGLADASLVVAATLVLAGLALRLAFP
jgi:hypothetical protein